MISERQRNRIKARDNNQCVKCMRNKALEIHHIIPVRDKGLDEDDNLHTLCGACHSEWTWVSEGTVSYETWLTLPPLDIILVMMNAALEPDNGMWSAEMRNGLLSIIQVFSKYKKHAIAAAAQALVIEARIAEKQKGKLP